MKQNGNKWVGIKQLLLIFCIISLLPNEQLSAQNRKGGGKPSGNKAAANRPAAKRPEVNRPTANKSIVQRPGSNNNASNRQDVNRPGGNNRDANNRNNVKNSGNRKGNVDNSRRNVNINVDNSKNVRVNNSRNTMVRHNSRPYTRPPYAYGGYRYRCYHPYYYHPYRPFVWGPRWHPWGFFVTTLAATAIILTVDNDMPGDLDIATNSVFDNSYYPAEKQYVISGASFTSYTNNHGFNNYQTENAVLATGEQYYYDEGVYYLKEAEGYTVVAAPIGATIKTLPTGYETVSADENTKNYYYGGTFYEKSSKGYTVVAPTAGTIVNNVSDGGEDVKMGEVTYVKLGDTYFQPIKQDGKEVYEVADVEEDK